MALRRKMGFDSHCTLRGWSRTLHIDTLNLMDSTVRSNSLFLAPLGGIKAFEFRHVTFEFPSLNPLIHSNADSA